LILNLSFDEERVPIAKEGAHMAKTQQYNY
jgi:hypothetical protein